MATSLRHGTQRVPCTLQTMPAVRISREGSTALALIQRILQLRGYASTRVYIDQEQYILQVEADDHKDRTAFAMAFVSSSSPVNEFVVPTHHAKPPWTPTYRVSMNVGSLGHEMTRSLCTFVDTRGFNEVLVLCESLSASSLRHLSWLEKYTIVLAHSIPSMTRLLDNERNYVVRKVARDSATHFSTLSVDDPLMKLHGIRNGERISITWQEGSISNVQEVFEVLKEH